MRYLLKLALLLLLPMAAWGQTVVIQGIVRDPSGNVYQNGSGRAVLVPTNQNWLFGNSPVQTPITINALDSFGHFSVSLTNTSLISPASAAPQWQFSFCSVTFASINSMVCFTMPPLALTSSQDISAQIQAASAPLPISSGGVTVTGAPAAGNLARFASGTSITNTDLTGDVTTSGTSATTMAASISGAKTFTTSLASPSITDSGLATGCVNNTAGVLGSTGLPCPGGTVSSVGLATPPELLVTNSPVTTSGTLTANWSPEGIGTVFGVPQANGIGGQWDGTVTGTGNAGTSVLTINPNGGQDWAWFVGQVASSVSAPTVGAPWALVTNNGALGSIYNRTLASSAQLSDTMTFHNSAQFADAMFLLQTTGGAPTVVQSVGTSGGFSTIFNTAAMSSNVTAGNGILVILEGAQSSNIPLCGTFSDSAGNFYTQIAQVGNGTNAYILVALTTGIGGGVKPIITFTNRCGGTFTSNLMFGMEVSGLLAATNKPSFHKLQAPEMDNAITGLSFQQSILAGDVAVAATTLTTVDSKNITMPANGCPCRVYISFGYGWTYTLSGAVDFYVTDGTNNFIHTPSKSTSAGSLVAGTNASGYTNVTYANNAVVTFTVKTQGEQAYTIKAAAFVAGPNSFLQLLSVTSN